VNSLQSNKERVWWYLYW